MALIDEKYFAINILILQWMLLKRGMGNGFSLNGPTSRPIKNIALGSEIKETIQGDLRHQHILLFWGRTLQKIKRDIDNSC